jgi:dihydrofolate reductase
LQLILRINTSIHAAYLEMNMRRLIVTALLSIDGVIQSPGNPEEDPDGDFRLGGWMMPYVDEAFGQAFQNMLSRPFELLLGRRTYDILAAHWSREPADSDSRPIADLLNCVPKHVITHRSGALEWQNSHRLEGDFIEAVRVLKRQSGADLLTQGSGDIVHQLFEANLVDELRLLIYPIILRQGKRLFDDNAKMSTFTLAYSARTPSGLLIAHYMRSDEVRSGVAVP